MTNNTRNILAVLAGTAICYGAISIADMPIARSAVLTYNLKAPGFASGLVKFSNSGIVGIGIEEATVSEGRLNTVFVAGLAGPSSPEYRLPRREYYDLAGAIALFFEGEFRGIKARGSDRLTEVVDIPDTGFGEYYTRYESGAAWSLDTNGLSNPGRWISGFEGYTETYIYARTHFLGVERSPYRSGNTMLYELADTAAEPVPEPMTVAGTALALVGFAGFKQTKKMAS
ncbi:MAG: PEP-CTERM sorting domain-containing protein [Microcoleus sp. PH2017_29_MFU_D_A]|uniref:PEP-CTERM sorting domain-containing protein n=1 Tax=unclassified Microcoleus TaxID=2642155 RepID=UPI001D42A932|nr:MULTISPECIES: PEP-CTERM sorting domain-containing protein [unclassified Microcoleus]MCC3602658.1 PEP-CTERM sorting domain-containing protein [Microcoleus sp. PH2017_29_MFU_D_A]MCC3633812.1 PEP-CTERM sorting domain-containing protein [Microcoleus sp. PH2017_37_MFU_D_B]